MAIGAVATMANPVYTQLELSKQVQDCHPKLIITVPDLYVKIKHFRLPCVLLGPLGTPRPVGSAPVYSYSDFVTTTPGKVSLPAVSPADVAVIMYTSGTGGASKGAVITHGNLIAAALMMAASMSDREAGRVALCFLPMFHMYALSTVLIQQLHRGDTLVVMSRYQMEKMLTAVERYEVTRMFMVPPVAVELVKKIPLVKKYNVSSLREVITGAAPLGKDVLVEFSRIFPHAIVIQAYGMTESSGMISMGNISASGPHYGSTGRLVSGMEARIMNLDSMTPLPPYQKGEIWIRAASVMQGYLNNHKATVEAIDNEGWLHTGDLGYFDDEGRLYVVSRIKELIKYKGYQVAPVELEELLLKHPQVVDAAVVGIPDDVAGEVPMAFVVRAPLSLATAKEIKEFIAKQVAPFKKLRNVIFTEAIPKSSSGKILKRELTQQYLSKL